MIIKNFKQFINEGSCKKRKTTKATKTNEETNKYQTFFKGKLAQWKVDSPNELSQEDKDKFFKEIKDEWTEDTSESFKSFKNYNRILEYNFTNYELIADLARELVRLGVPHKLAMSYVEDYVTSSKSRETVLNKLKVNNKKAYDFLYNKKGDMQYKGLLKGVDWE